MMLAAGDGHALADADGDGNLTQGNLTDVTLTGVLSGQEESSSSEAAVVGIVAACSTVAALALLAAYRRFAPLRCRLSREDTVLQLKAAQSERQHDLNYIGTELTPPPPPPAPQPHRTANLTNLRAHGLNGRVGLVNLGNTCFMNAALQCLSHTRWLADHFRGDEWRTHAEKATLVLECATAHGPGLGLVPRRAGFHTQVAARFERGQLPWLGWKAGRGLR